jgi:hypothetical protein
MTLDILNVPLLHLSFFHHVVTVLFIRTLEVPKPRLGKISVSYVLHKGFF